MGSGDASPAGLVGGGPLWESEGKTLRPFPPNISKCSITESGCTRRWGIYHQLSSSDNLWQELPNKVPVQSGTGQFALLFEEEAASAGRAKGYRVNLNFQLLEDGEKKSKRQAIAQIILQSFRREKPKQ